MTFEDAPTRCCTLAADRLDGWKTEWERRIKAEKERDKARAGARLAFDRYREVQAERQKVVDELYRIRADEQPRPLTADDISDEMIERAREVLAREEWVQSFDPETADMLDREDHADTTRVIIAALTAALTEPTRPEGAENIEAYMREFVASHPEDHYGELADHLASRGVLPPLTDKTDPARVATEGEN